MEKGLETNKSSADSMIEKFVDKDGPNFLGLSEEEIEKMKKSDLSQTNVFDELQKGVVEKLSEKLEKLK